MTGSPTGRVTPFGHLRITRCLLLPAVFRSLPRPSSPDSSKASSVDPYSLDHITHCPFPFITRHAASLAKLSKTGNSHVKDLFSPFLITKKWSIITTRRLTPEMFLLEVRGLEPLTYGLQSHRSSQLSYTPGYTCRPFISCGHFQSQKMQKAELTRNIRSS